jgi:hypothetical protein
MSNHFHLLLEVPPMAEGGLDDAQLLDRLSGLYPAATVSGVAAELAAARQSVTCGLADESRVREIHARFTYRMHDLSEFMKGLLIRFTRWFNRTHSRTGTLWEERFKSVIVESGVAARTMAAYIDLNPVRAGMVEDPADYRWSSYGEAVGGGAKGTGRKAREGLVRAFLCDEGVGFESAKWRDVSSAYRRLMGMALQKKKGAGPACNPSASRSHAVGSASGNAGANELAELRMAGMLRCRVRYFTDGAVIGSKAFVNQVFSAARERFTARRVDGARRLRGSARPAAGLLWSMRDLRTDIG